MAGLTPHAGRELVREDEQKKAGETPCGGRKRRLGTDGNSGLH